MYLNPLHIKTEYIVRNSVELVHYPDFRPALKEKLAYAITTHAVIKSGLTGRLY